MTMTVHRRNAFTMVELIFGMATCTILLGALTSAMIIATKAVPDADSPLSAAVDGAATVDQLATDLFTAHTITTRSATSMEFQVADRNNDGCPETISYEWSGVAGAPLKRKYNDALPQTTLADVHEFELVYDTTLLTQTSASGTTESAETLLASNVGPKYRTDWPVTNLAWIGQFFRPTLPAGATSWKITRVELLTRASGTNTGIARIELRYPDVNSRPTGALIADANILERELSTGYLWQSVPFAATPSLSPSTGACIVIKWLGDTQALDVQYQNSRTANGDDVLTTTMNAGSTWATATNQGLLFKVYGMATASAKPTVQQLYTINSVRIKLRSGAQDTSRVETTVTLPNEPEVTGT